MLRYLLLHLVKTPIRIATGDDVIKASSTVNEARLDNHGMLKQIRWPLIIVQFQKYIFFHNLFFNDLFLMILKVLILLSFTFKKV
jgi:hypothetical protein